MNVLLLLFSSFRLKNTEARPFREPQILVFMSALCRLRRLLSDSALQNRASKPRKVAHRNLETVQT
jgi:hypothetical protein